VVRKGWRGPSSDSEAFHQSSGHDLGARLLDAALEGHLVQEPPLEAEPLAHLREIREPGRAIVANERLDPPELCSRRRAARLDERERDELAARIACLLEGVRVDRARCVVVEVREDPLLEARAIHVWHEGERTTPAAPRTWPLGVGWKRGGLLSTSEVSALI
jgi:hypothetical protein